MEPFFADLIKDPKVPKPIRYGIVVATCAFIVFVGIICMLNSPFFWGKIFGILLAIVFFFLGIYLCVRISKSNGKTKVK